MKIQVNTISQATDDLISAAVYTVKKAYENFVQAYRQAFTDCCGDGWEQHWREWEDFEEIVDAVEHQMRSICIARGMDKSVWTKYRQGCRNVVWFGLPFKFRKVSTTTVIAARKLADKYTDDIPTEKKINKAIEEIQRQEQVSWAANTVMKKGGAHILRLPADDEDAEQYARHTLDTLQRFLNNEKVQAVIKSRRVFDEMMATITEALAGPKKSKKVG